MAQLSPDTSKGSLHLSLFIITRAEDICDLSPLPVWECAKTPAPVHVEVLEVLLLPSHLHDPGESLPSGSTSVSGHKLDRERDTHTEKNLCLNEEGKVPCLVLMKLS